jgi:iodotyrosine deiodinase
MAKKHALEFIRQSEEEMVRRAEDFYGEIRGRRSVRDFSDEGIPEGVLEACLRAAGTAPSGANLQPWHFAVVRDGETKRRIRKAAEEEEQAFYEERAPGEWLEALADLGTDADKPFLEKAPVLIAIFQKSKITRKDGEAQRTYYAKESVGIATGFLIVALHRAGLATLTHTPSPMGFLGKILHRPPDEKAFLLLVVGYPETGCEVPGIEKEELDGIASFD